MNAPVNISDFDRARIELIVLAHEAVGRAEAPYSLENDHQLARIADRIAATARAMN